MKTQSTIVGRAPTVLVFGSSDDGKAVVSAVVAKVSPKTTDRRLVFVGPAVFDRKVAEHLNETVLPVVDGIVELLRPGADLNTAVKCFEVSIVNLSAASVGDIGLSVSGYSADVAVLLALLSATLKMPMPQDIVATGHVASCHGDIRPVASIPAKLAAAAEDPSIKKFVYPSINSDMSLKTLSPNEQENIRVAVIEARAHLRPVAVADVNQLCRGIFDAQAVVPASLRGDFFEKVKLPNPHGTVIERAASFLGENNENRFWSVLEKFLITGDNEHAGDILLARSEYQIRCKKYPEEFGLKLSQLVRSLPPTTRQTRGFFPLMPKELCLKVCKFAGADDYDDVSLFLDVVCGKGMPKVFRDEKPPKVDVEMSGDAAAGVNAVLLQISEEALARNIGLPIDTARGTYVMSDVIIDSSEMFHDAVAAFYLAMLRHMDTRAFAMDDDRLKTKAYSLLERAFRDKGGIDAAQSQARYGTNGGMRLVLDAMTEQFKVEQQAEYVDRIIKTAVDPLDWDDRVAFMKAFMDRLGPYLPSEIRNQSPMRFARHYREIIRTYVHSVDRVKQLLRTL